MEQKFNVGDKVNVLIMGSEWTGTIEGITQGFLYHVRCDDCGKIHIALEEEMELISEPTRG